MGHIALLISISYQWLSGTNLLYLNFERKKCQYIKDITCYFNKLASILLEMFVEIERKIERDREGERGRERERNIRNKRLIDDIEK